MAEVRQIPGGGHDESERTKGTERACGTGTAIVAAVLLAACGRGGPSSGAPENAPAKVKVGDKDIAVRYDGREIFRGGIVAGDAGFEAKVNVVRDGDVVTQTVLLTPREKGGRVSVTGNLAAGPESFPCEADRPDRGPALVRHVSGLSRSLLNRAVYDRGRDWAFSVDAGPRAVVAPTTGGTDGRKYAFTVEGSEIVLRFRPRYYQVHRGLRFFEPWTYRIWPDPVAGWISWFAFYDEVTEKDIVDTADTLAETLLPYGYDLLQIDDGYQRGEGRPDLWLTANDKFPRGLAFLPDYIRGKGLKPGIWTNVAFKQADYAEAHKDWFVTDRAGRPARGNWVEFSLDASVPEAVDAVVRPVYRGLRDMGWEYFKVDALRHLRYEGYNAHAAYFQKGKKDLVAAYRRYVEAIRQEVGRDFFILGCWGIRPELVGLIDGCRIGTDGFSYAGLAQFNSWNNVVWRNDPDHIELDADRWKSTLVTSLTGSILLVTDKPAVYRTDAVEPARRAAPVPWTLPGQIYDVDPSRSGELARVDTEVSGSGPARLRRLAPADLRPLPPRDRSPVRELVRPRPDRRIRPGDRLRRPRPGSWEGVLRLRVLDEAAPRELHRLVPPRPARPPLPLPGLHPQGAEAPSSAPGHRPASHGRGGGPRGPRLDRRNALRDEPPGRRGPLHPLPDRAGRVFFRGFRGSRRGRPGPPKDPRAGRRHPHFRGGRDGRLAGPVPKKIAR